MYRSSFYSVRSAELVCFAFAFQHSAHNVLLYMNTITHIEYKWKSIHNTRTQYLSILERRYTTAMRIKANENIFSVSVVYKQGKTKQSSSEEPAATKSEAQLFRLWEKCELKGNKSIRKWQSTDYQSRSFWNWWVEEFLLPPDYECIETSNRWIYYESDRA